MAKLPNSSASARGAPTRALSLAALDDATFGAASPIFFVQNVCRPAARSARAQAFARDLNNSRPQALASNNTTTKAAMQTAYHIPLSRSPAVRKPTR